jgi:hypothetical protein
MLNMLPAVEVIYQLHIDGMGEDEIIKILQNTKGLPKEWSKKLYF